MNLSVRLLCIWKWLHSDLTHSSPLSLSLSRLHLLFRICSSSRYWSISMARFWTSSSCSSAFRFSSVNEVGEVSIIVLFLFYWIFKCDVFTDFEICLIGLCFNRRFVSTFRFGWINCDLDYSLKVDFWSVSLVLSLG